MNDIQAIASLLTGTVLESAQIIPLEIPETQAVAFAIEVNLTNYGDAWSFMRSHIDQTKRWPVVVTCWSNEPGNWQQSVVNDLLFSRFYFEEEVSQIDSDSSPDSFIVRAETVDREKFLAEALAKEQTINPVNSLLEILPYSLEETQQRFGIAPAKAEIESLIQNQQIRSRIELERWLFNWELTHVKSDQRLQPFDTRYLDWYAPLDQAMALLLLPTLNSWDALAYLHWYAGCSAGSDTAIAFLKHWHQRYQAELVCHYGTMLQLQIGKRPTTPDEAFQLAWEQEALAECTTILPGVSLRDHARALLQVDRWFLHERP